MQRSFAVDNSRFLASTLQPAPFCTKEIKLLLAQILNTRPTTLYVRNSTHFGLVDVSAPLLLSAPLHHLAAYLAEKNGCEKDEHANNTSDVETIQYFQGIGLVDDFYLSLVSWSRKYNRRAVALGPNLYFWGGLADGIDELKLEKYHLGHITCISYSRRDILLVCTARSYVVVYSQLLKKIVATTCLAGSYICCAEWLGNTNVVFAGNDKGLVYCLQVSEREIVVRRRIQFHEQQICGTYWKWSQIEKLQNSKI